MEFNWSVFWALPAVFAIVLATFALRLLWRVASAALRSRIAKVNSPEYLIDQAFQGQARIQNPAPPLDERAELCEEAEARIRSLAGRGKDCNQETRPRLPPETILALPASR